MSSACQTAEGADPRTIVLHASIDVVRLFVIHGNVVELPNGQVVDEGPVFPAIAADVQPAVVPVDQIMGI